MKSIYILLLYLPSGFGRLSQKVTCYPYTHAALSLDDSYTHFYAFSRLRAKTPPISGFIEEKRSYYTLGKNTPIDTRIFEVPVTEKGYHSVVSYMNQLKHDPEIMYNLINMLLLPIFGGAPVYKALHCGEFIAKVLEAGGMTLHKPYYRYTPRLLAELLAPYEIYEGTLDNSSSEGLLDEFFQDTPRLTYVQKTCYILYELIYRQVCGHASKGYKPEKVRI